ncbi:HEXXH motif domain-containing protein [Streptomyces radicis]|uniref:HEXXH motif domain-containing protein n=1 Tax=Streptomyces radicis TaxID=1750517 RepID=A0A3A9WHS7_9ACTN|nr:HEXXH motif domain-containing protein [Streptomyces radicis]RKN12525.1 HEXXH motif domain-containing protein [Streptomyces radicis]RKN27709.1 HEXXH motif domain-containing protein [Streptomyces radicis]
MTSFGPDSRTGGEPRETRRHRLPAAAFAELARGSGGQAVVARLRAGQRSRAMLLLRALIDLSSRHPGLPGPLPPPRVAWELLLTVERHRAAEVDRILLHPQVGAWLSRALRALRGRGTPDVPLWREVGHVHAVAASAALRSGIAFRATVPVRHGGVMIPALGFARLPEGAGDIAEVRADGRGQRTVRAATGGVHLPRDLTGDAPGWSAVRRLRGGHGPLAYAFPLDDLDPYRNFLRPLPPERLGEDAVTRWATGFARAWPLVAEQSNVDPAGVAACLASVVPVPGVAGAEAFSASSPEAHGCVLLSPHDDPESLAASLIHETQHIKLSALLDLVPLIDGGLEEIHYAPWRSDPRPLRGILQGVYAFLGVTGFWQARRATAAPGGARRAATLEFALRRTQTAAGLRALREHARLTAMGERFLDGIAERLAPWLGEPVADDLLGTVDDLATDHRIVHRMRHLRPDEEGVNAWAHARRRGQEPPVAAPGTAVLTARTGGHGPQLRLALARIHARDPAALARAADGSAPPPPGLHTAPSRAELAWAAGDRDAALRASRAVLDRDPDDVTAWSMLTLALPPGPAKAALTTRPELVLALHRALRKGGGEGPDPTALAVWAARGLTG